MVHLLGSEDWPRAAAYYGNAGLTQPESDSAARVLADRVLAAEDTDDRLRPILRLLGTQRADAEATLTGTVAQRFLFNLDGALEQRADLEMRAELIEAAGDTLSRLTTSDPGNAGWQRDLSVSHSKLGDVLRAQGNLPAALSSYQASLAISDHPTKADPANAGWQRDLSVSHSKIGNVLVEQGNLPAALSSYQASLAISDLLAKAVPGNARWQRELSVAHSKIGDVLWAEGNLPAALSSYEASLAISDPLAKATPGNAVWQRDLSVCQEKIGDVLRAQGNLPAGLTSYQASLAIRDRLVRADREMAEGNTT